MNASVLLLSSVLLAGADPAPVAAAPAAPVIAAPIAGVAGGCGCSTPVSSCSSCEPSCGLGGLLDRLRARLASFHKPKCHTACAPACAPAPSPCCAPAPAPTPCCGTPIFTGFTTSCHDPCDRHGLLAKLRAKFHGSRHCDACAVGYSPVSTGCAPAVGTVLSAPPVGAPVPATPPDAMPKPDATKK